MEKMTMITKAIDCVAGTDLEDKYSEIFKDLCEDYSSCDAIVDAYNNCVFEPETGSVGPLVYYSQTDAIFKDYFSDIFSMLNDFNSETGSRDIYDSDREYSTNRMVWETWIIFVTKVISTLESLIEEEEEEDW